MKMNYIYVTVSVVFLALDFVLQKKYQAKTDSTLASGLRFNAFNGLFTAFIFFALSGFKIEFSLFSLVMAFLLTVLGVSYILLGFKILHNGGISIYSVFLMSGGMLLPNIFGILFLDEPVTVLRTVGIIVILTAVILTGKTKTKVKSSLYLLCTAVFILNGGVSIVSKCHQISTSFQPISSTAFVMYTGIFKFLLCGSALLFCKKTTSPVLPGKTLLIILASALISGISYLLQLIAAKALPATVLYPLVTGGSILFSTLAGKVFFKEKLSAYQVISIILCVIGTFLFF